MIHRGSPLMQAPQLGAVLEAPFGNGVVVPVNERVTLRLSTRDDKRTTRVVDTVSTKTTTLTGLGGIRDATFACGCIQPISARETNMAPATCSKRDTDCAKRPPRIIVHVGKRSS